MPGGPVRLLATGGSDARAVVLGRSGANGELAAAVALESPGYELTVADRTSTATSDIIAGADFAGDLADADLVVHSFANDFAGASIPDAADLEVAFLRLVELCKEHDTRLIALGAITCDSISDERPRVTDPLSLALHRLDKMLIEVSRREGISVVDVDRVIAQTESGQAGMRPFEYTESAIGAVRSELLYVLEDYGFFDDRPLLEQRGASR